MQDEEVHAGKEQDMCGALAEGEDRMEGCSRSEKGMDLNDKESLVWKELDDLFYGVKAGEVRIDVGEEAPCSSIETGTLAVAPSTVSYVKDYCTSDYRVYEVYRPMGQVEFDPSSPPSPHNSSHPEVRECARPPPVNLYLSLGALLHYLNDATLWESLLSACEDDGARVCLDPSAFVSLEQSKRDMTRQVKGTRGKRLRDPLTVAEDSELLGIDWPRGKCTPAHVEAGKKLSLSLADW